MPIYKPLGSNKGRYDSFFSSKFPKFQAKFQKKLLDNCTLLLTISCMVQMDSFQLVKLAQSITRSHYLKLNRRACEAASFNFSKNYFPFDNLCTNWCIFHFVQTSAVFFETSPISSRPKAKTLKHYPIDEDQEGWYSTHNLRLFLPTVDFFELKGGKGFFNS